MSGLTPKQEKFAQGVASGKSQADAYREAYPRSKKWDQDAVYSNSSDLAANAKVLQRVEELRKPVIAKLRYGLEQAMNEAEEGMLLARKHESPSAFVSAVTLRSKLNGLLIDRAMNVENPFAGFTNDELRAFMAELKARIALRQPRETDITPKSE